MPVKVCIEIVALNAEKHKYQLLLNPSQSISIGSASGCTIKSPGIPLKAALIVCKSAENIYLIALDSVCYKGKVLEKNGKINLEVNQPYTFGISLLKLSLVRYAYLSPEELNIGDVVKEGTVLKDGGFLIKKRVFSVDEPEHWIATKNGEEYTIKFLRDDYYTEKEIEQWKNSIETLIAARSPLIDNVVFYGNYYLLTYYAMHKYGDDVKRLDQYMGEGGLSIEEACHRILQIIEAVNFFAHKGILLREISPKNVRVVGNSTRLAEFGMARKISRKTIEKYSMTLQMSLNTIHSSTPGFDFSTLLGYEDSPMQVDFVDPEILCGKEGSIESDIYAVGVLFYYMLTGKTPFSDMKKLEIFILGASSTPLSLSSKDVKNHADTINELNAIIQKCIKREPEKRYHSFEDLMHDIYEYNQMYSIQTKLQALKAPIAQKWQSKPPVLEGASIYAYYFNKEIIPGDYYQYFPYNNEGKAKQSGIFLGDITDHGITSAIFLGVTRGILQMLAKKHAQGKPLFLDMEAFIRDLNDELGKSFCSSYFLCFLYGILNIDNYSFTYARGGIHAARFIAKTKQWEYPPEPKLEDKKVKVLGIRPSDELFLDRHTYFLSPGDHLVLFTDGFSEVVDEENNSLLGHQCLCERMLGPAIIENSSRKKTLDEMHEDIIQSFQSRLNRYTGRKGKSIFNDDATMLIIKIH
ncbi:MAG: SpoIIE family protein phosphatase [Candidatus Brocadiae bacterium]|nr:SpoIIE family protein phosphatase [Candidatus Brocadiia bacterium]